MAFPYLTEKNWETGDTSEWDSETDVSSLGSVKHYTDLAKIPPRGVTPFNGAYAYHVALAGGTNGAYLTETADFDTAAAGTIYIGFAVQAYQLSMATNDAFSILELIDTGDAAVAVVRLVNTAGTIYLSGGKGTFRATPLEQGKWHWVELGCTIDAGGGNNGTIDFYVDGVQVGAQITGVDQNPVTYACYGVAGPDAGTSGNLIFGPIIASTSGVGHYRERYPAEVVLTKTRHVFVGPGTISQASITSLGADDTLSLYDTDTGYQTGLFNLVADMTASVEPNIAGPFVFQRGCFAVLGGANPRARVSVDRGTLTTLGFPKAAAYNDAGVKRLALNRRARSNNI